MNHFVNPYKKEAPAAGRGLSLGRKRPRRTRQRIAYFNRWRNCANGRSGDTFDQWQLAQSVGGS